jgi:IS5 family transposase
LLAESLRVAHETGALRPRDLQRVTEDTTVQPKAITFPTDAKLLHAAIMRYSIRSSNDKPRFRFAIARWMPMLLITASTNR